MKKMFVLWVLLIGFSLTALSNVTLNEMQKEQIEKFVYKKINNKLSKEHQRQNAKSKLRKSVRKNSFLSSITKMGLDSMIVDARAVMGEEAKFKNSYLYDEYGNVIEELIYGSSDPESGDFIVTSKDSYKYNSQNKVEEMISQYFDDETKSWVINNKEVYSYDNHINLIEIKNYSFMDNEWYLFDRTENIYDVNNNLIESIIYFVYDENEMEITNKYVYTYNSSNQVIEENRYVVNFDDLEMIQQITYKYENGNLTEVRTYEISYESGELEEVSYTINEYNDNNQLISTENHYKDFFGDWEIESKNEYVYDSYGNVIEDIEHQDNPMTGEFGPFIKSEITYNYDYTIDKVLFPDGEDGIANGELLHMPEKVELFVNFPFIGWTQLGMDVNFYYSEKEDKIFGRVAPISKSKIKFYPNPTADVLNIELENNVVNASIQIMDLQGKKVHSQNLLNSNEVDVRTLQTGTYIILINENGNHYGGKFIKE
jgi:hypothetical protein